MDTFLNKPSMFYHCAIEVNEGLLFHATLENTGFEQYNKYWKRRTAYSIAVPDELQFATLYSVATIIRLNYRITYADWLKMSFGRNAKNCAHCVAVALNSSLADKTELITPDILFDWCIDMYV